MKISAVLITFNEEKKIAEALKSVQWADEILVVDSESTDETVNIARSLGAKVVIQAWMGFGAQKQFATDSAAFDWIFSLDADERVSESLIAEILAIKNRGASADGYKIPRLSVYMGREIRHGGWYPDWQLRLFDRRKAAWKQVAVHESVEIAANGTVSRLKGDILHYSVDSPLQHHKMIGERYAPLAARQMFLENKRSSIVRILSAAPLAFIRTYVLKAGFLDGLPGAVIAVFAGYHAFLKHLLLWDISKNKTSEQNNSDSSTTL